MPTSLEQLAVVAPPDRYVTGADFHPDNDRILVTSGTDETQLVWSLEAGAFLPIAEEDAALMTSAEWGQWSHDGRKFAVLRRGEMGTDIAFVLDSETRRPIHQLKTPDTNGPYGLRWHPSRDLLATLHEHDDGASMNFWDLSANPIEPRRRFPSAKWRFEFSADGRYLLEDWTIETPSDFVPSLRRVEVDSGKETPLQTLHGCDRILRLGGARMLVVLDGVVAEWDLESREKVRETKAYVEFGGLRAVSHGLGVCSSRGRLVLVDLETEKPIAETPTKPAGEQLRATFSRDGKRLLLYGFDTRLFAVSR